jgi:hypothetical protein
MSGELDVGAQFAAFVRAPIPYIAEALLVAGIVWATSRTFSSDAMNALRERLNLATDRLRQTKEDAEEIRQKLAFACDLLHTKAPVRPIEPAILCGLPQASFGAPITVGKTQPTHPLVIVARYKEVTNARGARAFSVVKTRISSTTHARATGSLPPAKGCGLVSSPLSPN